MKIGNVTLNTRHTLKLEYLTPTGIQLSSSELSYSQNGKFMIDNRLLKMLKQFIYYC